MWYKNTLTELVAALCPCPPTPPSTLPVGTVVGRVGGRESNQALDGVPLMGPPWKVWVGGVVGVG